MNRLSPICLGKQGNWGATYLELDENEGHAFQGKMD